MDLSKLTDLSVASPGWHGWIIAYFYLGGIAAGAYAVFTLAGLFGDEDAYRGRPAPAAYLAFPLVGVCGLVLIVDLNRPERFWHMLDPVGDVPADVQVVVADVGRVVGPLGLRRVQLRVVRRGPRRGPLARPGAMGGPRRRDCDKGPVGRLVEVGGAASAFFLGAYTGTLLSATNQPVWAQTTWLSPLFLASAGSTGVAAVLRRRALALARRPADAVHAPGMARRLGDRAGTGDARGVRLLARAARRCRHSGAGRAC